MELNTQIASNIRKTWLLFVIFLIVIIGLGWFFSYYLGSRSILFGAVIFSFFMSFISYWYSDKIILAISKAKPLKREESLEIYRIVEKLCAAANLSIPKLYIIQEAAPNAFATGRNSKRAIIAVTTGLLETLSRPELEGVISHELSHIGNRDILLQTVVVVLVGSVVMLSDLFLRRMMLDGLSRRDNREGTGDLRAIMFIAALIAVIFSPLIAKLIQLAISRKREFLADASGVLLTHHPRELAKALEKISRNQTPLKIANKATAHLFITTPFRGQQAKGLLVRLFSTHPPIEERIKRLREINL
jgi:heat shock protein HtpX